MGLNSDFLNHLSQGDQGDAALRDLARMLGAYYRSLLESGFNSGEALEIILGLQRSLINRGKIE